MTPDAYTWTRFTPAERLRRFTVYLCMVLAVGVSFKAVNVIPEFLYDAPAQMQDLLVRMWPIEWRFYFTPQNTGAQTVHQALMDSLAIAFLATALGLLLATPVGFLAARNINRIVWLNALARFILVAGRPLKEPIAQYGPFVMNTQQEIYQAINDYRAGRLGEAAA